MRTDYVQIMKMMGNTHCLAILLLLDRGSRTLDRLVHDTGYSETNIGYHIKRLRDKGLVCGERDGHQMVYRLADRSGELSGFIGNVAETFRDARRLAA